MPRPKGSLNKHKAKWSPEKRAEASERMKKRHAEKKAAELDKAGVDVAAAKLPATVSNVSPKVMTKAKLDYILRHDVVSWCIAHQIYLPSAGKVFSLDGHEYLDDPYTVNAPLMVFEKGAQLGFSERAVLKSLHDCLFRLKVGLIYYFPTKGDVTDFSKARFGPLINDNAIFGQVIKDTDSANIKRVGKCMLYLRGLRSAISAKSAPADKLVFDEIDEAPPEMVDLARKRLDHSEFQEVEVLSTPTIPDYGVDSWFQLTDQRYRQIFCEACNTYTCLEKDFPECLIVTKDGAKRVCKKCKKELDLHSPRNEYVAEYPNREYNGRKAIGFRISQLHSLYVNLNQLWDDYQNTKFPADFYNSRLAQPYIDASNRLEVGHVLGLCGTHGMDFHSKEPCAIGVDIGPDKHNVVIGRKEYGGNYRITYIGETDWAGLDLMISRYNGSLVLDGMPEPERAKDLAARNPYKVWACFYSRSGAVDVKWNDAEHSVRIYQSQAMDASHALLQMGKIILPAKSDVVTTFAKHCHNVARKKVEDEETGDIRYQWIKLGADHYRKAFNFMVLAGERTSESTYTSYGSMGHIANYNDDFVSSYGW